MSKNTILTLICGGLLVLFLNACGTNNTSVEAVVVAETEENPGIWETVDVEQFKAHLNDEGAMLVDVRTDAEMDDGIIAGAVQIEYNSEEMLARFGELDKNKPVLVYCAAGGRSGKVKYMLQNMGFQIVYDLDGGMGAWESAGMSVAQP
jgi:rhodanese-related sulfurtransferase